MIKIILFSLLAIVALVLLIAAFQPADYLIKRQISIAAPLETVFEHVNSTRKFTAWNPWAKVDPNMKNTYSGPEAGVGSTCAWDGNNDVGAGTQTIIESLPGKLVRERMDWKRPMEGTSTIDFTFETVEGKTVVTWSMYGKNNYVGKIMCLFMNMDKMVGPQFETGLASLKALAEAKTAP